MFVLKILPLILVVSAVHLYMLIRCMGDVLKDERLNRGKKALWIIMLLVIQGAGSVIYLIASRRQNVHSKIKDMGNGLDENVQNSIFLMLFYTFVFLLFVIVLSNPDNVWIAVLLSVSTLLLAVIHFCRTKMNKTISGILPYILVMLVTVAEFMSVTQEYKIIVLVSVAAIIIEYPLSYSKIFFIVPLFLFQMGSLIKMYGSESAIPSDYLLSFVFRNTITYMLVVAAFYFIKRQLIMNNYLNYLLKELKSKTQELEETSILKERNRIAREIHDTLGHTLTGAIIQLEAAKKLIHTSPDKAEESILKTQAITRQGFNDVKRAIKALRPIMIDENTLEDGLELLFERMRKDYGYMVDNEVALPACISDDMKISVYRIIQELITNSVRHGEADEMKLNIEHQYDTLRINCHDNGKGCSMIKEGNGLKGIRERVAKLGGHVDFAAQTDGGFTAIIYIPL